jgi:nitrogen PTS system EIIA component
MLSPEFMLAELQATDRAGAIAELVEKLDALGAIPREARGSLLAALLEKEHAGGTAIGSGVAIPHCYSPAVSNTVMIFGRSLTGITYDAPDAEPVQFVLLYLVPEDRHLLHLQTLRVVAKNFLSTKLRQELLAAPDATEMYAIFRKFSGA